MSGHHDNNHSSEQKPVAFTTPFILACVTIVAILSLVSLGDPCCCKGKCETEYAPDHSGKQEKIPGEQKPDAKAGHEEKPDHAH
jgi:hypothetical protein